ncbi:MAG: response regulator [Lachnospiraceae bacterium]
MYKVLIADDEAKVCKLIQNVIDWEALGVEVVGIAQDGITALQIIEDKTPDIVITDIRMPGYDGLQLIEKAKALDKDIYFIIISGHRQFDYAHNAIKFGVEDYLLKPIREEELISIVTRVVNEKDKLRLKESHTEELQQQVTRDAQTMRRNFMENLIANPNYFAGKDYARNAGYPQVQDESGVYQAVVIKPDIAIETENEETYLILLKRIQEIVEEEFARENEEFLSTVKEEGVFLILHSDALDQKEMRAKLKKVMKEILRLRDLFWNIQVTVGLGLVTDALCSIQNSIYEAKRAVLNRLLLGTGRIIESTDLPPAKTQVTELFNSKVRNELLKQIEILDVDAVVRTIEQIKQETLLRQDLDGMLVALLCSEIIEVYDFGFRNIGEELSKENMQNEFYRRFCRCVSLQEVFEQLLVLFRHHMMDFAEDKRQTEIRPIRDVKKYVQQHYQEALRLEDMGKLVGFNATYFSSIFKKETGQGFSEYLIQIRVDKAKELLAEQNIGMVEVAEQVGYSDLKYFSRLFKKVTGLSPSDYRKLYHKI